MICTETYLRRVTKKEEAGTGLGVCWEAHIIYQLLYEDATRSEKFLPVLLRGGKAAHIPTPLRSFTHYLVDSKDGYQKLYRTLTNQPRVVKPKPGRLLELPAAERTQNDLTDLFQDDEEHEQKQRRHVAQYNNAICEIVRARTEGFVDAYNKKHPYRFARALNLVSERYSLYYELSIRLIYPEERSLKLRFKFTEAILEYSYLGVEASSGVLETTYTDSNKLIFKLEGQEITIDDLLAKLFGQLLPK
jgi:hypothetical protein